MSDVYQQSLKMHAENAGKIEVISKVRVTNKEELSLAYSPGVAQPCLEIQKNPNDSYKYTARGNMIAVITDGTAVLGLGDIGPAAAMPVMEGKCILLKEFADVNAFPICLDTKDTEEIIKTIKYLAPSFGGINLEDISAPRCIEIETRLKNELDIPVFHDDQHGTAIVVVAGLINAFKLMKKDLKKAKVVINGAGAAGSSICKLINQLGVGEILILDKDGILTSDKVDSYNFLHKELALLTNPNKESGYLADAIKGADVFVGVSVANCLTEDMVRTMNKDAVIFAMANPSPEIMPEIAKKAGIRIMGTGRSDYPNQVNNVLAFPGLFKGALRAKSKKITEEMKMACAVAIANVIKEEELTEEYIIPGAFDKRVPEIVASEVERIAKEQKICRED
ncbi:MAG: NAD(P)-dependent malic enzyme [Fusobacteriaceae bacterium]